MRLVELEVENLKPYQQGKMTFPGDGVALIIGANNSGKTALLSALDVLSGQDDGANSRRQPSSGPTSILATFEVELNEREAVFADANNKERWLASDAFTKVRYQMADLPRHSELQLVRLEALNGSGQFHTILQLHEGQNTNDFQASRVHPDLTRYFESENPNSAYTSVGNVHYSNLVNSYGIFTAVENSGPIGPAFAEWRGKYYHFASQRPGGPSQTSLQGADKLDPSGNNLANVLLTLHLNKPNIYETIKETITSILPAVGELRIPIVDSNNIRIEFENRQGSSRNLKDLGTGVEQIILSILVGVTQPSGSTVVIEEIESHLHPGAQRELMRHVQQWSRDKLFIIATHSPTLIDQTAHLGDIWIAQNDEGNSTIAKATDRLEDALDTLGVRLSDVLGAEIIVAVEGVTDRSILQIMFPDLLQGSRVSIVTVNGGDASWHSGVISEAVEASDKLERRMFFIRDHDELNVAQVSKLTKNKSVHVLAKRELENYLLDLGGIVAALSERFKSEGKQIPDDLIEAEVERHLRSAADGLKDGVKLKTLWYELSTIRLIDRKERDGLVKNGFSIDKVVKIATRKIPLAADVEADIRTRWERIDRELDAKWAGDCLSLAPGADVLTSVWSSYGYSYDKARDGRRLAEFAANRSSEIEKVLNDLMKKKP